MTDKKVRGSVINGYLTFVGKTWGKVGLENCLADTKLKEMDIKDGITYPNTMLLSIIKWISGNHGMEYIRKAGSHTVKNLGLLSYIVRFARVETMLGKAEDAYREVYMFGEVDMKISGKTAVATMKDVSEIPENCQGWIGALEALLEITRTEGIVEKTKCQLKGDTHCEYRIAWR